MIDKNNNNETIILKEKKAGRHISQKVVFITIEIKIIVQKP